MFRGVGTTQTQVTSGPQFLVCEVGRAPLQPEGPRVKGTVHLLSASTEQALNQCRFPVHLLLWASEQLFVCP